MSKLYHTATQLPLLPLSKVCATCDQEKPLEDFTPSIEGKYGRIAHCRPCMATKEREKRAAKRPPKPIPQPGYKFCIKCEKEKPLDAFYTGRNACKSCRIAYSNEHTNKRKDTPEYQAWLQEWHSRPEYKEKNRAHVRRWRRTPRGRELGNAAHRRHNKTPKRQEFDRKRREDPQHKAYLRSYNSRPEIKQRMNEKQRIRYLTDLEYRMRINGDRRKRQAIKMSTEVGEVNYQHILERDGFWCYICEHDIFPHQRIAFDHRIPLQPRPDEPKGTHTEENIFVTHHTCNARKRNKPFEALTEWDRRGPD